MEPTSGRLSFTIGKAFPVDDPVAVFLVALSTALNDLVTVSKWLVGGNREAPNRVETSDVERLYLLRLSCAQFYEVRESILHSRKDEAVVGFLDALPEPAKRDLDRVLNVNTNEAPWLLDALEYVRHQTNHYGGKWNWDALKWAMKQVSEDEGEIEMVNPTLVGMRVKFADHIANQHLTRKFPEYVDDPDAELDQDTIEMRLRTLVQATSEVVIAAQNFAIAALQSYFDTLDEGSSEWCEA